MSALTKLKDRQPQQDLEDLSCRRIKDALRRGNTRHDDLTLTVGFSRAFLSLRARGRGGRRPHKRETGLLFPAEALITGLPAPWATCLIHFTASGCPCPGLSPALGHFTCKYMQRVMPGFTMTSPGYREKGCMSLGVGVETPSKNCELWTSLQVLI